MGLLAGRRFSLYDAANITLDSPFVRCFARDTTLYHTVISITWCRTAMNGPEVVIVDEFTGRLMTGRRWSDGLHQAVEAKEHVQIQNENQTLGVDHIPELLPHVQQVVGYDRYC